MPGEVCRAWCVRLEHNSSCFRVRAKVCLPLDPVSDKLTNSPKDKLKTGECAVMISLLSANYGFEQEVIDLY